MNKTISMGNLTDDPKITETSTGKKKAEFTLALNRMNEGADYPRFVAWDKKAEFLANWCHKGMKLLVEGRIQTGSYENREGKKVYTTDIICENIEFCEKKKEAPKEDNMIPMPKSLDDEIPFK